MKWILLISVLACTFSTGVFSQMSYAAPGENPIVIPVVVHILYNTPGQNISNEQVMSQIAALNRDYRKKNDDARYIPAAFKPLAADTHIEFRLATVDPSGVPTSGVTRTATSSKSFGIDDKVKSALTGGQDGWNRNQYLNIWVCNLSGTELGYSSLPGCVAEKDGVVIRYAVFGTTPNVASPYNKGRTTVHEVGHWLGLRHIWGDSPCGDDKIDDTPPQKGPTRGCPSGVVSTCTSGAAGNMYMNFMDFTNDACTSMFTVGQAAKMHELFEDDGARVALLSSRKAEGASNLLVSEANEGISLYPNPAFDMLNIRLAGQAKQVTIMNHLGQICRSIVLTKNSVQVNIRDLAPGMYFVSAGNGKSWKFVKH